MDVIASVYLFVLGASFGSFALVLADRMHAGKDWVRGRSVCDSCGHQLRPHDLVPLLSWTLQRGKCRYCGKKVSAYYPLTELGLALAFVASYFLVPYELTGAGFVLFGLWLFGLILMAALVVADFKWYLLPSKLVYPLSLTAFVHRCVAFFADNEVLSDALLSTSLALLIGAGLFWVLNKASQGRWIGDGDYRLGVAIALFLGDPLLTWMVLFLASVFGLIAALPVLIKTRKKSGVKIPFGPFLMLGLGVAYTVGQHVIDWYSEQFLGL